MAKAKSKKNKNKVLKLRTPKFRGSFVALAEPRAYGDNDPKYSLTIVLDKDDPFWDKLRKKCKAVAEKRWDKIPSKLVLPIKDGDESDYADWEGCHTAIASSIDKPGIIDETGEQVTDRSELYGGRWYRAVVRPYAWEYAKFNRKGVSLNLDNVMIVECPEGEDDSPFSGRADAADDFADFIRADDDEDEDEDEEEEEEEEENE